LAGILIEVQAKGTTTLTNAMHVRCRKTSGNFTGSYVQCTPTTTEQYFQCGSTSSLAAWGTGLPTISDINSSTFGAAIDFDPLVSGTLSVNHVRITIGYTPASGGPHITQTRQAVMRAATR